MFSLRMLKKFLHCHITKSKMYVLTLYKNSTFEATYIMCYYTCRTTLFNSDDNNTNNSTKEKDNGNN